MISEKEKQFINYWQIVREKESTFLYKFFSGLPMAFLFGLPIIIFFVVVKIFLPSWFATASYKSTSLVVPGLTEKFMTTTTGDMIMAFIAVIIIILFFSFFRKHYNWETNEQLYNELKAKEKK